MINSSTTNSTINSGAQQTVNNSFLQEALSKMAETTSKTGIVARAIENQSHANVANQIALTFLAFQKQRLDASVALKTTGVEGEGPVAKPEFILSFVQQLMNQVCWQARRLTVANNQEEFANGIDFSQDVAEQVGVSSETENVSQFVDDDFMTLNNLHTWLGAQMSYLNDIQPLYYFAQNEEIDGVWQQTHAAMSFYDAQCVMTEIVEKLTENQEAAKVTEAASMDFSAAA